ncbi:hypothetical protein EFN25_04775 [Propionibacterium freudenreichii]|nr:hypothetical protein [Propionibacterium freudenreichii]
MKNWLFNGTSAKNCVTALSVTVSVTTEDVSDLSPLFTTTWYWEPFSSLVAWLTDRVAFVAPATSCHVPSLPLACHW